MGKQPKRHPLQCGLALSALAALPAAAQQVGPLSTQSLFFDHASNVYLGGYLEADAGLVYTNNVTLAENGASDTLALLGLRGDFSQVGSRLDYRLNSDIALVKYLHSGYPTQPFGSFDAAGLFRILPGFFSWIGRESFSQAVLSPLNPITPDNLESVNYATTGPRFTLRPTLRTTITLDGTYSYVSTSSKSPFYVNIDNHRYEGEARYDYAISSISGIYLVGSREVVRFSDRVDNTNFTQNQALAGMRLANARTLLDVSGGYSKLRVGSDTPSGVTWSAELARQTSPTQRVTLFTLRQVTDAANLFRLNVDQPAPSTAPYRVLSGDPLTDREFGATWQFQRARTFIELAFVYFSERRVLFPALDRDVKDASASFARQLNPVLNWQTGVDFAHQDIAGGDSTNTVNAFTSLRWQVGARAGLRFFLAHTSFSTRGSTANEAGVTAYYALTGAAGGAAPGYAPLTAPGSPLTLPPRPQ